MTILWGEDEKQLIDIEEEEERKRPGVQIFDPTTNDVNPARSSCEPERSVNLRRRIKNRQPPGSPVQSDCVSSLQR